MYPTPDKGRDGTKWAITSMKRAFVERKNNFVNLFFVFF
jgi:hypothetical protein